MNRVAVEQAIARGGIDQAVRECGVTRDLAEKVLAWMDNPVGEPPMKAPGWDHAPCGTAGAYRRHLRRGEQACRACMEAARVYAAEKREKRRRQKQESAA